MQNNPEKEIYNELKSILKKQNLDNLCYMDQVALPLIQKSVDQIQENKNTPILFEGLI